MGSVTGAGVYNYGDTATVTAIANTGYHFVMWNDGDTNALRTLIVTDDVALTATFAINQYTVALAVNDTTMGMVRGAGIYNYGDTAVVTAVAFTGYHFVMWNDSTIVNPLAIVVTSDTTLTATFAIDSVPPVPADSVTFIVAVNDSAMGTTVPAPGTYRFAVGDTASVQAVANNGYQFVNWSLVSGLFINQTLSSNPLTTVIDSTMANMTFTLTANFAIDSVPPVTADSVTFIVTVNDTTMGTTVPAPGTYRFAVGDTASVQAVANNGYQFVNWNLVSGALVNQTLSINPLTAVIDSAMANMTFTVTANFASDSIVPADSVTVILTINDTTRGTTNPVPGTYRFAVGDSVYAAANAFTGYRFLGWSIMGMNDMVSDNPIRMAVPAQLANMTITVTANFVPMGEDSYTVVATPITTEGDINAGGTVEGNGTYPAGSNVTLIATADNGYRFVGWYSTADTTFDQPLSTEISYSFVIMENTGLWAVFTPESNPTAIITIATNDSTMGYVMLNNDTVLRYVGQIGEEVTIEAFANEGYRFVAWSDGDTNALRTITLEQPVTALTARFEVITTGIDDAEEAEEIVIYTENDRIIVRGAENRPVYVFDIVGRLVAKSNKATAEQTFQMTNTGIYMIKVGNAPARRVVVRR